MAARATHIDGRTADIVVMYGEAGMSMLGASAPKMWPGNNPGGVKAAALAGHPGEPVASLK